MKITHSSVYGGPNLYALFPVIRHRLDTAALHATPSNRLGASFIDRLMMDLPGLREDACFKDIVEGLMRRPSDDQGMQVGRVMARVIIALQHLTGAEVCFGATNATGEPGIYHLVYAYEQSDIGLAAGLLALAWINRLLPDDLVEPESRDPDFDFAETRDAFLHYTDGRALNYNSMVLVRAAQERAIPWMCLDDGNWFQLGHGRHQRRIFGSNSGANDRAAIETAWDKCKTVQILGDLGLPVPRQLLVHSKADALEAAERIGGPVVVKPRAANFGSGVSTRLTDPAQVAAAFDEAHEHNPDVLIESFIEGDDHRMLVVDGRLIATTMRIAGHVVGDGQRTVEALVEELNADPRRGIGNEKPLTRLQFDEQAHRFLQALGYTKDTVPGAGERVYLRAVANISTGGTALDVTDVVHADNRELAVRAVKAIGLKVGGVDFLTPDIRKSYKEIGGAICEVNAAPGLRLHVAPRASEPRDVAGPVIDLLYPPGAPCRIPIAAITGTKGKTTTTRMIAHIVKLAGFTVGLAASDGAYIDGERAANDDMAGAAAARMILCDPRVGAAVLETAPGDLVRHGMSCDRCTVGAVLNVSNDDLGPDGIDSLEQMAAVQRTVVQVADDTAVLNADDELCLAMAEHASAWHICYVTMMGQQPFVADHIRGGGRAVVLENDSGDPTIVFYDGNARVPVMPLRRAPATRDGRAAHNVQNAMFAIATCFALGIEPGHIRQGLEEFAVAAS